MKSRDLKPCCCDFQKKSEWGYEVFSWVGGHLAWKPHGAFANIDAVKFAIEKEKRVLVTCRGCGADVLREY